MLHSHQLILYVLEIMSRVDRWPILYKLEGFLYYE